MNVEIIKPFTYKTGFVTGLLLLFSYMLGSCGTEANFNDPEELANTIWKLDYIQAEEENVFPGEEDGEWFPDSNQYLNFVSKDTITNIPVPGPYSFICSGPYQIHHYPKLTSIGVVTFRGVQDPEWGPSPSYLYP